MYALFYFGEKEVTNHRYPFQEHAVIDIDNNLVEFKRIDSKKCQHIRVEIDTKEVELTCKDCGVKVNPVLWIKDSLQYFQRVQNSVNEEREKLKQDKAELENRARTKCQHCNKMTGINLKNYNFRVVD